MAQARSKMPPISKLQELISEVRFHDYQGRRCISNTNELAVKFGISKSSVGRVAWGWSCCSLPRPYLLVGPNGELPKCCEKTKEAK